MEHFGDEMILSRLGIIHVSLHESSSCRWWVNCLGLPVLWEDAQHVVLVDDRQ